MDSTTPYFAIALAVIAWMYRKWIQTKNLQLFGHVVPGPTGWRCWKAFLSGAKNNNLHIFAGHCARRYGDLVQVTMGNQTTIFINHPRTVRKLFGDINVKRFTNDRPPAFVGKHVLFDDNNTAFTHSTAVQSRRRKTFHGIMKFYGENVGRVERILIDIVSKVSSDYQKQSEIQLSTVISETVLTIIHALLAGENPSEKQMDALRNFNIAWDKFFVFEIEAVLQAFPFVSNIPGLPFKQKYEDLLDARNDLTKCYFDELKDTYVVGQERGFIDKLLTTQKKMIDLGDDITITDETIKASICEITAASYVSSKSFLCILFLILIRYPEIQQRMYADIIAVVDEDEEVQLKHRPKLPYIEAAIIETFRFSSNSPFLLPHYTQKDLSFDGLHIPQNSVLVMNAWHCHRREDLWEDPWNFKPERFLNKNGELLQADDPIRLNMISFGAGTRMCPAENFAKSRIFLIATSLLKQFEFFPLDSDPLPSDDPRKWPDGYIVKAPGDYKCGLRNRKQQ